MAVGIRTCLPFKGIHVLLGNDLTGDEVVVNPLLTNIQSNVNGSNIFGTIENCSRH